MWIEIQEFGLGQWHDYQSDAFYLKYKDKVEDHNVFVFASKKDCEGEFCDYNLSVHSTKGYYMVERYDTLWKSYNVPDFNLTFEKIILSFEEIKSTKDSSNQAKAYNSLAILVESGRFIPLSDFSKSKLRHLRHQFLASKDHRHHAGEITEYFLHRHKRRHIDNAAIEEDFTSNELQVLRLITELIY